LKRSVATGALPYTSLKRGVNETHATMEGQCCNLTSDFLFAEFFATAGGLVFSLRHNPELFLLIINQRIGRHALHQKNVAADGRSCADHGLAAENGRARINYHVVFHGRMTFAAFLDFAVLVLLKAARAEGDAVIELHPRTDLGSFANNNSGAVIDEKMRTDFGARVNVDPSPAVRPLGHDSWNQGQVHCVKNVRH